MSLQAVNPFDLIPTWQLGARSEIAAACWRLAARRSEGCASVDEPPEGVVRAFYCDIQDNFDGQVIVMENTDPLDPLGADALDIRFTKSAAVGRYGFMPAVADERPADTLAIDG